MTAKTMAKVFPVGFVGVMFLLLVTAKLTDRHESIAQVDSVGMVKAQYETRLKEAQDGLAFWKRLYEKQLKASVSEKKDSTFVRSVAAHNEIPFYLSKNRDRLEIGTVRKDSNTIRVYTFDGLGRNFDATFGTGVVSVTTSNDWFVFNGVGLGVGTRYALNTPAQPYLNAMARATLFKRVEVQANGTIPFELRLETHYLIY